MTTACRSEPKVRSQAERDLLKALRMVTMTFSVPAAAAVADDHRACSRWFWCAKSTVLVRSAILDGQPAALIAAAWAAGPDAAAGNLAKAGRNPAEPMARRCKPGRRHGTTAEGGRSADRTRRP